MIVHRNFRKICLKLDALSHASFTPRKTKEKGMDKAAKKPETEAITVEEITPITVSNAALLAPEEIHEKSDKLPLGELEKTSMS